MVSPAIEIARPKSPEYTKERARSAARDGPAARTPAEPGAAGRGSPPPPVPGAAERSRAAPDTAVPDTAVPVGGATEGVAEEGVASGPAGAGGAARIPMATNRPQRTAQTGRRAGPRRCCVTIVVPPALGVLIATRVRQDRWVARV